MISQQERKIAGCLTVIVLCQLLCLVSPVKSQFLSLSRLRTGSSRARQVLLKEIMNLEVTKKTAELEAIAAGENKEPSASGKAAGQPEMPLAKILAMSSSEGVKASSPEHSGAIKPDCETMAGKQQNSSCRTKGARASPAPRLSRTFGFIGSNVNRLNHDPASNLLIPSSRVYSNSLGSVDKLAGGRSQNATESAPELLKMLLNLELLIDSLKEQQRRS